MSLCKAAHPLSKLGPRPNFLLTQNVPSFNKATRHPRHNPHTAVLAIMICRLCLRRASALARKPYIAAARPFSALPARFNASEAAAPKFSTPTTEPGQDDAKAPAAEPKSSCAPGTVLTGLNFLKGKQDPVALPDEEYPEWLWRCLEYPEKLQSADAGAADEFCEFSAVVVDGLPSSTSARHSC